MAGLRTSRSRPLAGPIPRKRIDNNVGGIHRLLMVAGFELVDDAVE
jgi:hypothetical protein